MFPIPHKIGRSICRNSRLNGLALLLVWLALPGVMRAGQNPRDGMVPIIAIVTEGRPSVTIPYNQGITVLRALAKAGLHADYRGKAFYLFHAGHGIRLDLAAIHAGRARNIMLRPWDIIAVKRAPVPNESL